jgi:hypothetical protein
VGIKKNPTDRRESNPQIMPALDCRHLDGFCHDSKLRRIALRGHSLLTA